MHLPGSLLLLLFTACVVSSAPQELAVWQLGNQIRCYQPGVNPLKFNDYGCWCGFGGQGTPLDELDQCCYHHDMCYRAARTTPGCTAILDLPYVLTYHYTCKNKATICSASNDKCKAAVCHCDQAAALCFSKAKYNPANKNVDTKEVCV